MRAQMVALRLRGSRDSKHGDGSSRWQTRPSGAAIQIVAENKRELHDARPDFSKRPRKNARESSRALEHERYPAPAPATTRLEARRSNGRGRSCRRPRAKAKGARTRFAYGARSGLDEARHRCRKRPRPESVRGPHGQAAGTTRRFESVRAGFQNRFGDDQRSLPMPARDHELS
jgi:hypothetical protein